jgi:hypothetical protein
MNKTYNMKYNVVKGNEVVKKNLSKKQAEEYCDKMNNEFKDKQESIRKQQHNAGTPLRKSKYELYKVEVVKESKIVRLSEQDLVRLVKKVIKEQGEERGEEIDARKIVINCLKMYNLSKVEEMNYHSDLANEIINDLVNAGFMN